jgi:starvation-inducible DNA-binding protein
MDELVASLKTVMANTFVMYFKTQGFHWNVEGIHFSQYHEFFKELYEDLYGAVDPLAENIRKLGEYAPKSLADMYKSSTLIESDTVGTDVKEMLNSLLTDNTEVLSSLNGAFTLANTANEQGLANFIAERIDQHKKHEWQLKSSLKGQE